jgi:signal transduction histidine kinase
MGISLRGELDNPMVSSWDALYRDDMISAEPTTRRVPAVVRALWSAPTRRATGNALAALLVAAMGIVLLGGLVIVTGAAIYSLVNWPVGGWTHAALYVAMVLAAPVLVLWVIQGLAAVQQARLHATLGLDLPAGRQSARSKPWPVGPWRDATTWRQLGYHVLAVLIGGAGGGLVVACWLAPVAALGYLAAGHTAAASGAAALLAGAGLLLTAPWVARLVARADEAAARALLGPSRNEALALRVESLARSRTDILSAADAERRRIERDLHDGAQQRLVSLAMNLGMARARLTDAPQAAQQAIADAHDEALVALSELRDFIRGLHPAVLNDRGLAAALSGLAARAPLPVRLHVDTPRPASASIEAVAYFIVSEALANVAKHAQATRAEVTVVRDGDLLRIEVTDDGRGGAVPAHSDGTGLRGLAQRATAVDGTLTIDSPPGGPTVITVELPCES